MNDAVLNERAMVPIAAGDFVMGSDVHYPEEAPAHRVRVTEFLMEATPVTNERFATFVAATRYVTEAERQPDPADYPGILPDMLQAGSLVFIQPESRVAAEDWRQWWRFVFGADWRHPYGPHSNLDGLANHPVVHVNWADAVAYANWAEMDLPTEAEWERAARGGLHQAAYAWGEELTPDGRHMANIWQGNFPHQNLAEDGYVRTSPVGAFPANALGLYDMIGNVWEWTADWYADHQPAKPLKSCCIPANPRGGSREGSLDGSNSAIQVPRKVLKGGSHLCAPNYCQRYRPAARHAQEIDSSTSHIGFRCVLRPRRKEAVLF